MKQKMRRAVGGISLAGALAAAALGAGPVGADNSHNDPGNTHLKAHLDPLNNSGASGWASAAVKGNTIEKITVRTWGLTPDAPHAQHIHFGAQARHECPNFTDDVDKDNLLNTVEGVPAYGPIAVSLTTSGDTSPISGLDVTRMPVSADEHYRYTRSGIEIGEVDGMSPEDVAEAIRRGEGVVVVHGIDYNQSGAYDGDAKSELDAALPREATDPVLCGPLMVKNR